MELFIELTRRCNMTCSHCLRGNAENKSMPEHIALLAFKKLGLWDSLGIGGGEPLASTVLMKNLRHWLLYAGFYPESLYLVSNGLGLLKTPKIMETLNNIPVERVDLDISIDRWHDECGNDYDARDRLYRAEEIALDYPKISVSSHGDIRPDQLLGMGRRRHGGIEESLESIELLYVDVEGFVWGSCNLSYTFMKRFRTSPLCFGNVLTTSSDDIIRNSDLLNDYIQENGTIYITEYHTGIKEELVSKKFVPLCL